MSLEDMMPWSMIYGELNKRHDCVMTELMCEIISDFVSERLNVSWVGYRRLSPLIIMCVKKGYITHEILEMALVRLRKAHGVGFNKQTYEWHIFVIREAMLLSRA